MKYIIASMIIATLSIIFMLLSDFDSRLSLCGLFACMAAGVGIIGLLTLKNKDDK